MATTHLLAGVLLAAATLTLAPEFAGVALPAAVLGSVVPDLDVVATHRRTLHFPVYYSAAAVVGVAVAVAVPTEPTVALALFLLAAALHCVMDAFGGGPEFRPWENGSNRAVYDHVRGRWVAPLTGVRYDGAPEDFLLATLLGAPSLVVFDGWVRVLVLAALVASAVYTALRRPLVDAIEWAIARTPASILDRLPERFLSEFVR